MIDIKHFAWPSAHQLYSAFNGMRNPKNSWHLSDSEICFGPDVNNVFPTEERCTGCPGSKWKFGNRDYEVQYPMGPNPDEIRENYGEGEFVGCAFKNIRGYDPEFRLGKKDKRLAKALIQSGIEHAKFLRQIPVTMDITAPLYWWKQMDQYRIGTTTDSCSTMHKLMDKEFSPDDFSFEAMDLWRGLKASVNDVEAIDLSAECPSHGDLFLTGRRFYGCDLVFVITDILNAYRNRYLECVEDGNTDGAKLFFNRINELLPQSYNQKRTWSANYAVLFNICAQRAGHKLREWEDFIEYVLSNVPYFKTLCFDKLCQISPAFNKQFNED